MKKINKILIKSYNAILAFILILLGFTISCGKNEYGTPHANYIVNGKVTSKQTSAPIKNIRVVCKEAYGDSSLTDLTGDIIFN